MLSNNTILILNRKFLQFHIKVMYVLVNRVDLRLKYMVLLSASLNSFVPLGCFMVIGIKKHFAGTKY